MPRWTEEQQLAIDKENTNIIVSAGAGSGKTAVLTARVIRKLKSGVGINHLLILTFTKKAAKEMKERYPEEMIERAVKGMLPKGRLGRQMYKKLFVYAGNEHKHLAQKPVEIKVK